MAQSDEVCSQVLFALGSPLVCSTTSLIMLLLKAIAQGCLDITRWSVISAPKAVGAGIQALNHTKLAAHIDGMGDAGLVTYAQLGKHHDNVCWVDLNVTDEQLNKLKTYCASRDIAFSVMEIPGCAEKGIAFREINGASLEPILKDTLRSYAIEKLNLDPELVQLLSSEEDISLDDFQTPKQLGNYTWQPLTQEQAYDFHIIESPDAPVDECIYTRTHDTQGHELIGIAYENGTWDIYQLDDENARAIPVTQDLEPKLTMGESLIAGSVLCMGYLELKERPLEAKKEIALKEIPSLMQSKEQIANALKAAQTQVRSRKQELPHRF